MVKTLYPRRVPQPEYPAENPSLNYVQSAPPYLGGGSYRCTQGDDSFDMDNDSIQEVENPFLRRDSIKRTPPALENLQRPHESEIHQPSHTERPENEIKSREETSPSDDRPKKRKKLSSPFALQLGEIKPSIELAKLKLRSDELYNFTRSNKNVHKEVKKFAMEITSLVKQAITRHKHDTYKIQELQKELQEYRETQESRYSKLENELQELRLLNEKRFEGLEKDRREYCYKCSLGNIYNSQNLEINNYEEFSKVVGQIWAEDSFKNIRIDHGDPFKITAENVVYFCDETMERQTRMGKRILSRHPELMEGNKLDCNGGRYTSLRQQTTYKTMDGDQMKEKNIIAFFYDPTKQDGRTQCDVFHMCQKLRDMSEHYKMR
ncbi:jg816, partial [Pararge aegeria aegeria]